MTYSSEVYNKGDPFSKSKVHNKGDPFFTPDRKWMRQRGPKLGHF